MGVWKMLSDFHIKDGIEKQYGVLFNKGSASSKGNRLRKLMIVAMTLLMLFEVTPVAVFAQERTVSLEVGEGHEAFAGRYVAYFNEHYSTTGIAQRADEDSHLITITISDSELDEQGILDLMNEALLGTVTEEMNDDDDPKPYGVATSDGECFFVLWENPLQADQSTDEADDSGEIRSVDNEVNVTTDDEYESMEEYNDQIWLLGSEMDLEFEFNNPFDEEKTTDFEHISVDSDLVEAENYMTSGSLTITLKSSFLNTLSAGGHVLTVYSKEGKSVSAKFTIKDKNSNGLPIIVINITEGNIQEMNEDPQHNTSCSGTMDITFPDDYSYIEKSYFVPQDLKDIKIDQIRGRGNSSWRMAKKPYKIKLEEKTNLFAMGKNKHWVLLANYLDLTLMKNRIVSYMGDKLSFAFTPECVNVEVYMNDVANGKQYYLGNYMLAEQVRIGDKRLEIDELEESDSDEQTITGGYLIQGGQQRYLSPDVFTTDHGVILANDEPSFDTSDGGYDNDLQKNYIRKHLQDFEDALYGEDFTNEKGLRYTDYVDLQTAVDYFLINEFSANVDAYATGSHYFYKVRDSFNEDGSLKEMGRIFYGPIWDFDKSFGTDKTDSDQSDEQRYYFLNEFSLNDAWFKAMLRDPSFVKMVKDRWKETIRPIAEELIADGGLIDRYYEENKDSQADDYVLWRREKENVYKEEIEDLKNRIAYRISFFDEHIDDLDNAIHKVDFIVDGKVDKTIYCYNDGYVPLYDVEKEDHIFLGWMDENGEILEELNDLSYDRRITACFVSKKDATKANEIYFLFENEYGQPGDRLWASYTLFPEDAQDKSVAWQSSDEEVASVDESGNVILLKTGKAVITATLASGIQGSYTVNVVEERPVYETIEVPETLHIKVGKHDKIEVKILPETGLYGYLSFISDDYDIAEADAIGVVKGLKVGETDVVVSANYYDYESHSERIVEKRCHIIVSEGSDYECEGGLNKQWVKGSNEDLLLVIHNRFDDSKTYDSFRDLKMDNKDVESGSYDASKGSLRLKLKASYLNSLSSGDHILKVEFTDGDLEVRIKISDRPDTSYRIPLTGIE